MIFTGTRMTRRERHIHVADRFLPSFTVTVAMLHVVDDLAVPVSFLGPRSVTLFWGVRDATTRWWHGHGALGFAPTAGFLGMMSHFVPKRANRPILSHELSVIHVRAPIFLHIWAGPHHPHHTALPDGAATLGMVFSGIAWMPSWGGMIGGPVTRQGAGTSSAPTRSSAWWWRPRPSTACRASRGR